MNQDLKELKKLLDRFKSAVDGLKPSENLVQSEDEITKILGEHERMSVKLKVSEEYKEIFRNMKEYIILLYLTN